MYEAIKNLVKLCLPKTWLLKNELFFRKLIVLRYSGKKVTCNLCGSKLSGFIELENGELLCPACGSLPRNRRLWQLLSEGDLLTGTVLDFSPSRCLSRKMRSQKGIRYVSSDFVGEFEAEKAYDITAIQEADDQFDLIICFHVLEHVINDQKAMRELYRVLKPSGHALIQTPFREGGIYENPNITAPDERLAHFGQEDHVRIYSVDGLAERLGKAGFSVEKKRFDQDVSYGMKAGETILMASKQVAGQ